MFLNRFAYSKLRMDKREFIISEEVLAEIKSKYPQQGKNSHIGHIAVEIVKRYFSELYTQPKFTQNKGIDLTVISDTSTEHFEIKGTEDSDISWSKLFVSGQPCYDNLIGGVTTLVRVTNVGQRKMTLYFMRYGEHFELVPEVRWKMKKIKK